MATTAAGYESELSRPIGPTTNEIVIPAMLTSQPRTNAPASFRPRYEATSRRLPSNGKTIATAKPPGEYVGSASPSTSNRAAATIERRGLGRFTASVITEPPMIDRTAFGHRIRSGAKKMNIAATSNHPIIAAPKTSR